ncbi:hypothetical protein FOA52_002525 [Chlamydomonas sp. UWO 241]|nr:hypothetical protein FOA52_002525 [Chlamydomonas sp. UWO 241]
METLKAALSKAEEEAAAAAHATEVAHSALFYPDLWTRHQWRWLDRGSKAALRCGQQLSLLATEVGWRPLSTDWLRQAARFWAKALRRPDGDLLKAAMRESWELAAGGVRESWVAQLSECLSTVGHTLVWGQEAGGIARLLETAAAARPSANQRGASLDLGPAGVQQQPRCNAPSG